MVPDPYTLEKMALAHRQKLQREAEHEQMLERRSSNAIWVPRILFTNAH